MHIDKLTILVFFTFVSSCVSREESYVNPGSFRRISFEAGKERIGLNETRAVLESGEFPTDRTINVSSFWRRFENVQAQEYFCNTVFEYGADGAWSADAYWPVEGTLDFVAVSAGETPVDAFEMDTQTSSVSFYVHDNSSLQDDLLYGVARGLGQRTGFMLPFRHLQSLLVFTAESNVPRDEDAGRGITLNAIRLNDSFYDGRLTIGADGSVALDVSGSREGSKTVFLEGAGGYGVPASPLSIDVSSGNLGIGGEGILILPQEQTSVTVEFTVHEGGQTKDFTKLITLDEAWQPNGLYVINLVFDGETLSASMRTEVDGVTTSALTVSDWDRIENAYDYSTEVTIGDGGRLVWDPETYASADFSGYRVITAFRKDLIGTFTVSTPVGSVWYAFLETLSGNRDAFRFIDADGNAVESVRGPVGESATLRIRVTDDYPAQTSSARLSVVVRAGGRNIPVTGLVSNHGDSWTIIQNAND